MAKLKVEKGDLVEVEHAVYNRTDAPKHLVKGIVLGTEDDWYMIKGHVDVNNFIIPLSDIKRIVKKQAVAKEMIELMKKSLFKHENPPKKEVAKTK